MTNDGPENKINIRRPLKICWWEGMKDNFERKSIQQSKAVGCNCPQVSYFNEYRQNRFQMPISTVPQLSDLPLNGLDTFFEVNAFELAKDAFLCFGIRDMYQRLSLKLRQSQQICPRINSNPPNTQHAGLIQGISSCVPKDVLCFRLEKLKVESYDSL